ncbi:GNAT family N-acetyltransferase [Ruminococcaceae bacterium OttesenSCG-928-O06]|nr:GNAT family N-acetyltransferase [Ruminococcaceae bacterium OttesenSCG-928-O06]
MVKIIDAELLRAAPQLVAFVEADALDAQNPAHATWLREKLTRLEQGGAVFFGYFAGGRLAGFASIQVEMRPPEVCGGWGSCELLQIGVEEQSRRQGAGKALLRAIEEYLAPKHIYCLYLHTYARDRRAISFYLKNRFVPAGTVPHVYGPGAEGMLFLVRRLQ